MRGIDLAPIRAELLELAGTDHLTIKLSTTQESALHIKEGDRGGHYRFDISLNPRRIRSPKQLERHVQSCRNAITG